MVFSDYNTTLAQIRLDQIRLDCSNKGLKNHVIGVIYVILSIAKQSIRKINFGKIYLSFNHKQSLEFRQGLYKQNVNCNQNQANCQEIKFIIQVCCLSATNNLTEFTMSRCDRATKKCRQALNIFNCWLFYGVGQFYVCSL